MATKLDTASDTGAAPARKRTRSDGSGRRRAAADAVPPAEPMLGNWDFGDSRRVRIGSSVIEEFVAGHDARDILRELVQNEYDGGGERLELTFGNSGLEVIGSGRGIQPDGWDRLSVIVGTGEVMGSDEVVTAKVNGIGSKNFGLRSLFLYGDQIYVRSRGRVALLDLATKETGLAADSDGASAKGVRLNVPYRTVGTKRLEAFTEDREAHAFDLMATGIPDTLVKLALGGRAAGLREVSVRSIRTFRSIRWRQQARSERSRIPGVSIVIRTGRLALDGGKATPFEEIEFARSFDIPAEHTDRDFPAYYRQPGGRLRIAVSLPIARSRIDTARDGHMYYPLKAPASRTGCAVSVSAPFELNNDRSSVNDNAWNEWLTDRAVDLVMELLTAEWFKRFGADAYLALVMRGEAKPERFASEIQRRLTDDACWPTRAAGARRFARARETVLPTSVELDGFLDDGCYLDAALTSDERLVELVTAAGAKSFSLASLVRLRCAGSDGKGLATKLTDGEAAYSYNDYADALSGEDLQVRLASALSALRRHLTRENKEDLRATASTLNALGELKPAKDLLLVGGDVWAGCPEPLGNRLHPALAAHRAISTHCTTFDEERWLVDAARRAASAAPDDPEREVLYNKLLRDEGPIRRRALSALRDNPVVRNQRGEWTAPRDMVALPRALARQLAEVVDAPAREMLRAPGLIAKLHIRNKLNGEDIVRYAEVLPATREAVSAFETLIADNAKLLSAPVVKRLGTIPCLMSRAGELATPATLHLDTATNRQFIDDRRIVAGGSELVHRRLKVRETPDLDTLLAMIAELKASDRAPARPELLYPTLVQAVSRERRAKGDLAARDICWVNGGYHAPRDILVGPRVPALLGAVVPVYRRSDEVGRAYADLGAPTVEGDEHWSIFLRHVGEEWSASPVDERRRRTLLEAYQIRSNSGLPDGLDQVACLLDDRNRLFSATQLRAGLLVEGDFPQLQQALARSDSAVGVIARSERSRAFFTALGVRPLSSIAGTGEPQFGQAVRPPLWFQAKHRERLLAMLHRPLFIRALHEVAYGQRFNLHGFEPAEAAMISRRVAAIGEVSFFGTISRRYSVAGVSVAVPTDVAVGGTAIGLVPPKTKQLFQFLLAEALAELAGATNAATTRALANALLPLVLCSTSDDLRAYLERIGIDHHRQWDADADEVDQDEQEMVEEEIVRQLFDNLDIDGGTGEEPGMSIPGTPPPIPPPPPPPPAPPPPAFELPNLESVDLTVAETKGSPMPPRQQSGGGGGGASGGWMPRTPEEVERDRKVGLRGEELVYRQEIERVRAMGHADPERLVIWTSRTEPGADHDIRSVDAKGRAKWIEVKSTTGTDGRFDWSRKEFEKAMRERDRYELWRVYLVSGTKPVAKRFVNPAGMIGDQLIALEIGGLRASIEGIG